MKSRVSLALLTLGFFLLVFACSSLDNNTLATIGDQTIPLEKFTSQHPASRFASKDEAYIDSKVDDFVRKALFIKAARDQGLDTTAAIVAKKIKAENRQMMQYVYDRAILDEVITDDVLKNIYDHSGTEIKARHILIQFAGSGSSRSDRSREDALALMGRIENSLSKGESFEELAKQFTEDPSGKENGGDLGWFGWGKMVGPFQEAAFALRPGEISPVVETSFGYHLIKVEGRREISRGSFEEEKQRLKAQARKEKSSELSSKANNFLETRKKEAGFELLSKNIHDFFTVVNGSSYKMDALDDILLKLSYKVPLFKLNGKEEGYRWIIDYLKTMDDNQKPRFKSENQLKNVLDQLVTQALIVEYGYAQNYDQEDAFVEKIQSTVDRFVYDAFVNAEINQKLNPSDNELKAYYEENKSGKYMEKEKVQVREIFVKDSLLAVDLKKRVDAGEMFDLLAGRYTERKASKDKRGELPPFQEGRYGLMGQTAFGLEVGDVAGPIKLGNGYSIIKLEQKLPAGPKPYSKVKGRVRTEIIGQLRKQQTDDVYNSLKKKYPVQINYEAVHAFYAAAEAEPENK
jgi:parvulin-like peptidyl-prolyl isomerase